MAVPICTWHDRERILTRKRLINHCLGILCSVGKSLWRRSRLNRLVPDGGNPASARIIPKNRVLIADSRVDKTNSNIFACQVQRLSLHRQNPSLRQTQRIQTAILCCLTIHQPITFGQHRIRNLPRPVVQCIGAIHIQDTPLICDMVITIINWQIIVVFFGQ